MSLDYTSVSSNMSSVYDTLKSTPEIDPTPQWVTEFKTNYDDEANNGTFSAGSVVMVSNAGALDFDVSNSSATTSKLASSITSYWSDQITPGTPQYAGIISVSNDASKIQSVIGGLTATTTLSEPSYESFFKLIEDAVKTII